jgi:hypothetical protein
MIPPWSRPAAGLVVLLLGPLLQAQYTFPPEKRGDMEAQLTVQAARQTALAGIGAVTLTLSVTGPARLEVEEPRLGDPTAAWKEERLTNTQVVENDRANWSRIIRLNQVKPGIVPVADVSVRFRDGPESEWQEARWIDILKQERDVTGPPAPPSAQPSWLQDWRFSLLLGILGLVLGAWLLRRRRPRSEPPLPPDQYALRELDRIEETLLPPRGEPEVYHTQLSHVLRRYLTERFGLYALQQTTAEFLEAVPRIAQLSVQQQAMLRDFFERCDLAKFARAGAPPEECRRTTELARELVRQTTRLGDNAGQR